MKDSLRKLLGYWPWQPQGFEPASNVYDKEIKKLKEEIKRLKKEIETLKKREKP